MVLHGGGPGLRVPRKRVVPGDVMWSQEDNGIVDWSNKAAEPSREGYHTEPDIPKSAVDGSFDSPLRVAADDFYDDPPLRAEDDFDEFDDSEEGMYWPEPPSVDLSEGYLLNREPEILFNLDSSHKSTNEEQEMEVVEEEVADSEVPETEPASSEGYDVDMGFDELENLLKEQPPSQADLLLSTMSQPGTDLALASTFGFSLGASESVTQSSNGNDKGFLSTSEQQRFAQDSDEDEEAVLLVGTSYTQESSLSQRGLLSPGITTLNFMLPASSTPPAAQAGNLPDLQPTIGQMFGLDFDANEHSRHSAPPLSQQGEEAREDSFGRSLHLSILDNTADEQSSHNMVFTDTSRTLEHGLSLQPFHQNIDHDRPSQTSGSVLASEGNFAGSIHTVDSATMARTPLSAGITLHKQVNSSKDMNQVHILLSDSDDETEITLLDKTDFPHFSGKRRAQDDLVAFSKKRPHLQGPISQSMYEAMASRIMSGQNNDWPVPWNYPTNQMQLSNPSGAQPLPNSYGSTGFALNHSLSLGGGRGSGQTIANTGKTRQLSVTYDLNVKNQQVVRAVPAKANSMMKDTLAGNNKEEDLPPEGQLSVPLLKHQRVALAWMKKRELQGTLPDESQGKEGGILQGGILADDQGLGKTISTIALILKERAPIKKISSEAPPKKISIETSCIDMLDDGDDSSVAGKTVMALPSTSEKPDINLPSKPSNCEATSSSQNAQADVVTVSSKFRPAAGTLVVCPTSVLRQWANEIKEKVTEKADLSVLIYHGSNRTRDPEELIKYDVVLTTYSIVSMEVPKQPLPEDKENGNKDDPPPGRTASKTKKPKKVAENGKKGRGNGKGRLVESENGSVDSGPLARVSWFRVVLDEAQSIKNARTQGARAAWGLRSKRRWCLSGTPIQNAVDDLYSYFRFLRYSPFDSYKKFRELVKEPVTRTPSQGYPNLLRLLTPIMLRRTKATKIDGQPIVKLPERIVNLRQAEFSDEERAFYNNLENESRKQFQDYAAAGTLQSNYVNILWMLLRLRQACDHPLLVKGVHHQSTQKVILDSAKKLPPEKRKLLLSLLEGNRDICPICSDLPDEAVVCVCSHIFCRQCISEQLATGDDTCCPVPKCRKSLNTSMVFTLDSLKSPDSGEGSSSRESSSLLEGPLKEDQTTDFRGWKTSSKIDAVIETLSALPVVGEVEAKDEPLVETRQALEDSKLEVPIAIRIAEHQEPPSTANHFGDSLIEGAGAFVAKREASFESVSVMPCYDSAAVKAERLELRQEDAVINTGTLLTRDTSSADTKIVQQGTLLTRDTSSADTKIVQQDLVSNSIVVRKKILTEKAIVFSQWTSMLDLLEAKLKEANFNYRRLDGTMSVHARDRAVSEFKALPEVNVIIMSLKAASLGLNMVAACHVLLLDVWWNPTTEDQAIDRAHRIGQTRPVNVSRFTVKNTIEDRILELQERKRHMVASAFGESHGGGNGHLSTAELDYLFNGENRGFNR